MSGILKRITKLTAKTAAVVAFAASMTPAQAEVFNFYYEVTPGNFVVIATMTTTNTTDFSLEFVYAPDSGGKINDLLMSGPTSATFSNLGGDTAPDATACKTATDNPCPDENTGADWKVSWPTTANNSFDIGEISNFRIFETTLTSWDMEQLHINAFLNGESIKLTGCLAGDPNCEPDVVCEPGDPECTPGLPEPGTLALLGAGIAGLALIRRRRRV